MRLFHCFALQITIATDTVFQLLAVAEDFLIPELRTLCEHHLVENLSVSNACLFLNTAMEIKGGARVCG